MRRTRLALVVIVTLGGLAGAPWLAAARIRHDILDRNKFTHSFHSATWLHPPIARFSGTDPDPGAGDIFADAENSIQSGPLIFDPQGQLIYFQPLRHSAAFNVQVQSYQGQTVLTYWQGYVQEGVGIGRDVILDHHYQQVAIVHAGHGYNADLHEFTITPQGDALITAYAPVKANLSSVGGSRHGTLLDSIIQKIDIATGKVLWEWHASRHVPVSATYEGKPGTTPYDYFHVNSIQQLPGGKLLISSRHTWAVYEIDMRTGRIAFTLGGKHSSFKMGSGTNFEWQHNAHLQPDGTLTVFDNASGGPTANERTSRALRIRLDFKKHRASLISAFTNRPPVLAVSQGNMQLLPDGNMFVGWGAEPYLSEFDRSGRQLFSLHFLSPLESYRGFRFPWWGQPVTPPSIALAPTGQGTLVYASWNGATEVASWRVLAGPDPADLTPVGQFPKKFFETTRSIGSAQPYFAVQALDSSGQVLGTSATVSR
jgi:hypothetical protein